MEAETAEAIEVVSAAAEVVVSVAIVSVSYITHAYVIIPLELGYICTVHSVHHMFSLFPMLRLHLQH